MEANKTIYRTNTTVPKKLMEIFRLSSPKMIALMMRQGRATPPVFPCSYRTILNQIEYIIHNSVTRLIQFSLGRLPTMSRITQKQGAGWDRINTDNYFNVGRMDDVLQKEVMMTTSHQYEEAYIQLMTMRIIKVV